MQACFPIMFALAAAFAAESVNPILPGLYPNQVAFSAASKYQPYFSKRSITPNATTWVQIDLGNDTLEIDKVELYPYTQMHTPATGLFISYAFPTRYKVEMDGDASFSNPSIFADRTGEDQPNPHDTLVELKPDNGTSAVSGRYLRLTATVLGPMNTDNTSFAMGLHKISALSNGKDVAESKEVTVDPTMGELGIVEMDDFPGAGDNHSSNSILLTRPPRPQGEGIVTDNPNNVIDPSDWKPQKLLATTPMSGVKLGEKGLFKGAMSNNIAYLLNDSLGSVEVLITEFLQRAGLPTSNVTYPPNYWDGFPGSNAARFLMGATNTLRWMENSELRTRVDAVISAIEKAAQKDGFIMAFAEDQMFTSEHGAYTRSMLTHGLLDAAYTGFARTWDILRGFYDWYNKYPYLDKLLRGAGQGGQGQVANTLIARSLIGSPDDVKVIQQHFQENYWVEGLAQKDTDMLWQYPYDHPHTYLSTALEAYVDLYILTGDSRYQDMVMGYWELLHDNWLHIGGSTAISEFGEYSPGSYRLASDTGELCGNSFWIRINQRLHLLAPSEEKYTAEIEKSLYNVMLANQDGEIGILYHANLLESKNFGDSLYGENINTCCEGQGTRTLGSLAEFIFSTADDGVYVNLYDEADITLDVGGQEVTLSMQTRFPFDNAVSLNVTAADKPQTMKIHVRVPSWAAKEMKVSVNGGDTKTTGQPGSYVELSRTWKQGDTITFTLPAEYTVTKYTGLDQVEGHERYGIEYGPVLMAVTGPDEVELEVSGSNPRGLFDLLQPVSEQPLHSTIEGKAGYVLMPYWEVSHETFTCFPVIDVQSGRA